MLRTTLANLRSHLRRLVSTSLAVVLGVGFLAGTLILGDSMRSSFDDQFQVATEGLSVAVRSTTSFGSDDEAVQTGTVGLDLVRPIGAVDGVGEVVPTYEGRAQIVGADGHPLGGGGPPTLGANWLDDPGLTGYRLAEGRAPSGPDEVVIDRASALEGELSVGDTTTVLTPDPLAVEVVGIATFGDQDSFGPVTYVGFTDERAAELFVGRPGEASRLLVAGDPGVSDEQLAAGIGALLPSDTEALTRDEVVADELAAVESDFVGFFEGMLLGFAGIALLVATFSIHNTFSILVAQRSKESALLRAIGASRAQVLVAIGAEAMLIGLVASIVGLGAGVVLAQLAAAVMEAAGFGLAGGVEVGVGSLLVALAVGVTVTMIASIAPSLAASRVAPLAAIREMATERTRPSRTRVGAGVVLGVVGLVALVGAPSAGDGAMIRAALGGGILLVATVVLGPVLARPVASVVGAPIAALRGQTGVLARRNSLRNPRRTAGTASALTIGVAVVAVFTVFASSVTGWIDDTVERSFGGDLVIASRDFSGAGLSSELAPTIEALPEVERAVGMGSAVAVVDGQTIYPIATEPERLDGLLDVDVREGSLVAAADGLAVSTQLADEHGWALGDTVSLGFADGSEDLVIGAVYGSTELAGDLLIPRAIWDSYAPQAPDVAVLVEGAAGVAIDELDSAVTTVADRFSAPEPQNRDEYVDSVAGEIEAVLGVIYGLLAVAVLIALMGIANTISLSVHERTRELGLLRAVGQSRGQLRAMVRWESLVVAVFGTVTGVGLGLLSGWGLLQAMAEVEGVTMPFVVPVGQLGAVVAIGAMAGIAAAWRPARRAARLDVLAALATE